MEEFLVVSNGLCVVALARARENQLVRDALVFSDSSGTLFDVARDCHRIYNLFGNEIDCFSQSASGYELSRLIGKFLKPHLP